MLQHRQIFKSGPLSGICGEHLIVSDEGTHGDSDDILLNTVDCSSGSLVANLSACKPRRNLRVVVTERHVIKYDHQLGHFLFNDRQTGAVVGGLKKSPPPNTYVACTCTTELSDNLFFYSYALTAAAEEAGLHSNQLHSVQAVLAGADFVSAPLSLVTDYKGSGFADMPQGKIVSMHCHSTQRYLFVVYSQGQVQVWSYAKCLQHLQQQQRAGDGGTGMAAEDEVDETGEDPEDAEESAAGDDAEGSVRAPSAASGAVAGKARVGGVSSFGGIGRGNAKKLLAQLLTAVATFALPTNAQLMRLDPEYEGMPLAPSSFRLDSHGRFAAVVWSERIMCVYDIYTLLILAVLQKPQTRLQGSAATAGQQTMNVVQLTIFGAFPCRAVPSAGAVDYRFGPLCFHPSAQLVLLTVLRHRSVPRTSLDGSEFLRMPLPPLVYAVSLRVHQPILSAVGCYEVGSDLSALGYGAGSTNHSVNWRPQSFDCTPHTGLLALSFQTSAGAGSFGSDAPPVEDITAESPSAAWLASAAAQDEAEASADRSARRRTSSVIAVYGLSPAWLLGAGLAHFTAPINSPLPVSPDCYVHGEGALSSTASYALRASNPTAGSAVAATSLKAISLVDRSTQAAGASGGAAGEGASSREISDCYPLLLALRPAFENADDGLGVNAAILNYHLFRTHWVFPSCTPAAAGKNAEGSSASYIGKVPSVLTDAVLDAARERAQSHFRLPEEHRLTLTGWDNPSEALMADAQVAHCFCPTQLLTREGVGMRSLSAMTPGWDALLKGVVHRSIASKAVYNVGEAAAINSAASDRTLPCVVFAHYGGSGPSSFSFAHANFRDAAYWARSTAVVTTSAAVAGGPAGAPACAVSVLALAQSGRQLVHLEYQRQSGAGTDAPVLAQTATWELGHAMSAIWTAPAGASNIVLLASASPLRNPAADEAAPAHQTLYASPPDPTAEDFRALRRAADGARGCHALELRTGEEVLEAQWQPLPSALGANSRDLLQGMPDAPAAVIRDLQSAWLSSDGQPLLAIRTSQRVLICTGTLRVLNEACFYALPSNARAANSPSAALAQAGTNALTANFLQRLLAPQQQKRSAPAQSPPGVVRDNALNLCWLGAALCYTEESGAVHYLLPSRTAVNVRGAWAASPVHRALGVRAVGGPRPDASLSRGVLCTFPRNLSTTVPSSHRVIAVLSDRVLVSYLRRDDCFHGVTSIPLVAFTQRPVNPMEPLVLGLLALENLGSASPQRSDAVQTLLTLYVSPMLDGPVQSGSGARQSAQSSRHLALALSRSRPVTGAAAATSPSVTTTAGALAVVASGLHLQQMRAATCGEFPSARWIPSGFKFAVAVQSRLLKLACMELASARGELQEMLLESDAYGGTAVPHPGRPSARQFAAAALHLFLEAGVIPGAGAAKPVAEASELQVALARRLLDIAGDYTTLCAVLLEDRGASASAAAAAARTVSGEDVRRADRGGFLALQSHAKGANAESKAALVQFVLQSRVGLASLGGSARRKNLTAGGTLLPVPDDAGSATALLAALEAQQREHALKNRDQQGPGFVALSSGAFASSLSSVPGSLPLMGPRSTGLLAKDLLEDFMGVNLQLEQCTVAAEDLFGNSGIAGDGAGGTGEGAEAGGAASGQYMGAPLPPGWVEGVGAGSKEHELVSGYWRFSDAAYPGEEGFHCSALHPSGTRLVFADLSRFEGPGLELFCPSASSVRVEYSTSPVDPGEKHENVKSLCDVLFAHDAEGVVADRGMRCPVPRGSQLDVGLYHADARRSKLTVEMMVCFDDALASESSTGSADVGSHILMQRRVAGADGAVLWSLHVERDGAVCFTLAGAEQALRSAAGAVPTTRAADGASLTWTHVALILDSSKALATISAGKCSQAAVSAVLVVKGDSTAAKLTPAPVPVAALDSTALLVGPGLAAGWKLTELRVWADARSASDLESQRDNCLVMAMKRKRLQLRVKGTKKLFTPYREIEVPDTAAQAIVLPTTQTAGDDTADGPAPATASTTSTVPAKKPLSAPLPLGGKPLLGGSALGAPKPVAAQPSEPGHTAEASAPVGGSSADQAKAAAPAPAPAPVMSARERRLSLLKGGTAGAAPAGPAALAPSSSVLSPPEKKTDAAALPAAEPAPKATPAVTPTATVVPNFRGPTATATESAQSPTKPAQKAASSAGTAFKRSGTLTELGLTAHSSPAGQYGMAKPFVTPQCWAECRTGAASAQKPSGDAATLGLHDVGLPTTGFVAASVSPFTSLPVDIRRTAESAICTQLPGSTGAADPARRYRVAVLSGNSLHVYNTSTDPAAASATLVAQMSMGAVRLAHWSFVSPDVVLLVSSTSAFTIRVTPPTADASAGAMYAPKPVKIFDRCDLEDVTRWSDRAVYDLQVCADGWTMLTTGPRSRVSAAGAAPAEVPAESMTVSLYHAKSGLAASFRASAGCFRFGLQQALLVWRDEDRLTQGPVWSVTALDLADLQAHAKNAVAEAPPAHVTNKLWRAPIDLRSAPGTLALHWTLQLQNADAFDKASGRDKVSAACLDTTSDPSQPSLRVASRARGELLSVSLKDFSHLLSSHAALPGDTAPTASATASAPYSCVVGPTPPLHAWSIGKLLYVLTKAGELHQCNIGASVPQYVGSAPLPLAQLSE